MCVDCSFGHLRYNSTAKYLANHTVRRVFEAVCLMIMAYICVSCMTSVYKDFNTELRESTVANVRSVTKTQRLFWLIPIGVQRYEVVFENGDSQYFRQSLERRYEFAIGDRLSYYDMDWFSVLADEFNGHIMTGVILNLAVLFMFAVCVAYYRAIIDIITNPNYKHHGDDD